MNHKCAFIFLSLLLSLATNPVNAQHHSSYSHSGSQGYSSKSDSHYSSSHNSSYHHSSSASGHSHSYSSSGHHHSNYAAGAARDSHGRIKRSSTPRYDFMKNSGYPHGRKGYVVDHIIPLKKGGCDCPSNMQWQTKEAAKAKDKWE